MEVSISISLSWTDFIEAIYMIRIAKYNEWADGE